MDAETFTIGYERLLPGALVADPAGCHRRVLTDALSRRRPGLRVIEL